MKKKLRSLFAILMAIAIAITAIPTMEAKAAETQEILVNCSWLDSEEGAIFDTITVEAPVNVTYGELKEIVPDAESTEDYTFLGWEAYYDDTEVVTGGSASLDATYDKYPVRVVRAYVDINNKMKTEEFKKYYPAGTTFDVVLSNYEVSLTDMSTDYTFTKWNSSVQEVEEVGLNKTYCEIFADYENHNIMKLSHNYVQDNGEYGVEVTNSDFVVVDRYLATSRYETELQSYFEEKYAPQDHYEELGFIKWEWWNGDNWDAEEQNDAEWALYVSNYSNAQIIFETDEGRFVYAPNPGETLELPTELDENNVSWECDLDGMVYTDSYTIPNDIESDDIITLTAIIEEAEKVEMAVLRQVYVEGTGWQNFYETYLVNENATIEEIMEVLPDADSLENCEFVGWEYIGRLDGNIPSFRAIYEKNIVNLYRHVLTEEGKSEYDSQTVFLDTNLTYGDLLASLEDADSVMGCTFIEWKLVDNQISLDEVIAENYVDVEAVYDKYPVHIQKIYADQDGFVKCDKLVEIYDVGTSMSDVYDVHKTLSADATGWYAEYYDAGIISTINNEIVLTAQYEDEVIVGFEYEYIAPKDSYGQYQYETYYAVLDKAICLNEDSLKEYFEAAATPQLSLIHYDKLSFVEWEYWNILDSNEDGAFDFLYANAIYNDNEKIVVHAWTDNSNPYVYVVNAGDVIQLPTEIEGYYYTWYEGGTNMEQVIEDGTYTVPADATAGVLFMVEAAKGDKVPETVTPPADNNPSGDNSSGETTPPSGTTPPETADTTTVIPYVTLLLFGAGVILVGNKKRNYIS